MTERAESGCVFCGIANGQVPASVVYQDELVLAFMDTNPVTTGHVLVIPKRHHPYLSDVPKTTGSHVFVVAQGVAAAIRRSGVRCEGINLFVADGQAAFQEVEHFHMHVFPRFVDDTFRIQADWSVHPAREELDRTAELIRAAMNDPGDR